MKKWTFILPLLLLLCTLIPVPVTAADPIPVVLGTTVSITDPSGTISITPHTLASSGWVEIEYNSKLLTGSVDVMFGFDGLKDLKPTKVENWTTYAHSKTRMVDALATETLTPLKLIDFKVVDAVPNIGEKVKGATIAQITYDITSPIDSTTTITRTDIIAYTGMTKENGFIYQYTHKIPETYIETYADWLPADSTVKVSKESYSGTTDWKTVKIPDAVKLNETTKLRVWIEIPFNDGRLVSGKYNIVIKPTALTLVEAKAQGKLILLDPWYNASWLYRKTITVDHTKLSGDLTNFPILVSLSTDANLGHPDHKAQADGDDILFTNSTGTKLDAELELFDTDTGQLICWVEVDSISSSTDTILYLYYGNAGCATQWTGTATWDANYKGVWHNSDLTTSTIFDSTASLADLSKKGANEPIVGDGKIYKAQTFDESNDYAGSTDDDLDVDLAYSLEFWINPASSSAADSFPIADRSGGAFNYFGIQQKNGTVTRNLFGLNFADTTTPTYADPVGAWHHIMVTYSHSAHEIFIYSDGGSLGHGDTTGDLSVVGGMFAQGRLGDYSGYYWKGSLDEVRLSNSVRTVHWAYASYNNQNSPGTFYGISAETEGAVPTVTTQDATAIGGGNATLNGTIVSSFENCTDRGFDWDTDAPGAPYANSWTEAGSFAPAAFSHIIAVGAGTYYYRAKAQNDLGWGYGAEKTLVGLEPPTVTSAAATNVSYATATLNGNLTDLGDYTPVDVYFEYGETALYGTSTAHVSKNTTGTFTANISGLDETTGYHFRAVCEYTGPLYVYGADTEFTTTLTPPDPPTNLTVTNVGTTATVTWTNGAHTTKTRVLAKLNSYPTGPTDADATLIYFDTLATIDYTGLESFENHVYYFRAWGWNATGYSTGYDETTHGSGGYIMLIAFLFLAFGLTALEFWRPNIVTRVAAPLGWIALGIVCVSSPSTIGLGPISETATRLVAIVSLGMALLAAFLIGSKEKGEHQNQFMTKSTNSRDVTQNDYREYIRSLHGVSKRKAPRYPGR